MRLPVPTSVFPPAIKISADEASRLISTTDRIVDVTINAQHEYIRRYRRRLHPAQWRVVKHRSVSRYHSMNVFQPRSYSRVPRPADSPTVSPLLVGTGYLDGSLDDAMLGVSATTTDAARFVMSKMYRDVPDARVLTRLDAMKEDTPYNFVGIKWLLKTPSSSMKNLTRPRDFVYLESTGIREVDGKRVGYQLLHSMNIPSLSMLPPEYDVVRGYMSLCFVFMEDPISKRVEVFCKGFVDPRGCLPQNMTTTTAAQVIVDCMNSIECARQKKIAWVVQERRNGDSDLPVLDVPQNEEAGQQTSPRHNVDNHRRRSTVTAWLAPQRSCGLCGESIEARRCPMSRQSSETVCASCMRRVDGLETGAFARDVVRQQCQQQRQLRLCFTTFVEDDGIFDLDSVHRPKVRLAPIQKREEMLLARRNTHY
ncbi:hypothetical protein Poli38472_007320 [Pythium oligandrum]|uniref:START domain-containing protein n=1 Tax=Pythium oligandrum TaxID=41045 RepID=A0A8K1FD89_PYTOL|nr:hypothetical protein Poli38472_007320 [Pythium oligandrum]|eukprot:TMW59175.1 hypothetical protein Poli38472_007320 [Pythium oligandrum]